MRKIFVAILVFAMVAVTGCGNSKKLTCTMKESGAVGTTELTYKKDKLTNISVVAEADLSTLSGEYLEYAKSMYNTMCSAFTGEGVSCEADVTDKKATMKIGLNLEKANAETLENMDLSGFDSLTMEEAKGKLADDGYTCK